MSTSQESIYDHPKWYDLVYGSDWKAEFDFLLNCFDHFIDRGVKSVFEPACGTGRLLYRLAKQGLKVSGNDLNPAAISYCNDRLKRHGLPQTAMVGDMCDFQLREPVDAAFNLVSSFRHLTRWQDACDHLACVARSLEPDGIYVLGFHLSPTSGEPSESEYWSASRGHLTVNTAMKLHERDWDNRIETFNLQFDVYTPSGSQTVRELVKFRMYSIDDFQQMLSEVGTFEIEQTFDFHYQFDVPIVIDNESEDVVFILRRK